MGIFGKGGKGKSPSESSVSTGGEYEAPKLSELGSGHHQGSTSAQPKVAIAPSRSKSIAADIEMAKSSAAESLLNASMSDGAGDTAITHGDAPTIDEPTVFSDYRTVKSTGSDGSRDSAFTITRNGQYLTLNGFANGHLMRWKFAAEEGPAIIRIPAVLLALGCIGTTVYPLVTITSFWTIPIMICAFHTCVVASLILVLEGRAVGVRSPTNCRARLRGIVTRYVNLFRLLWGRGLLYIFVGSMNLTIDHAYVVYTGFPLIALGLFAIGSGAHASYNLDKMKQSLTDEAYLWGKFDRNDPDKDNFIDLNGFAELLWSLGLEFDDTYTYKAFQQIDRDSDAKISFEEFKDWWIVTQNDGRKLRNTGNTGEGPYD